MSVDQFFITDTDDVPQGAENLYFSDALAIAALTGQNVSIFTNDAGYLTSFTESDPVFTASPAAGIGSLDILAWDTAVSWGNHASAGYLTSFTETDPVFGAHAAAGITASDIANLANLSGTNTGDQDLSGLVAKSTYDAHTILAATTDNTPAAVTVAEQTIVGRITAGNIAALTATQVRTLINVADGATANAKASGAELDTGTDDVKFATAKALADSAYLTSESDPVFGAHVASSITSLDIMAWDAAVAWGNHASAGYLTSESDPVFGASVAAGIDGTDVSNWNAAHGWGNHASAGYLTSVDTSLNYDWTGTHNWADNERIEVGAGGSAGALGTDGCLWSDGSTARLQVESDSRTGNFSGINPLIAYTTFNIQLGGAKDWVIAQRFGQIDRFGGDTTTGAGATFAAGIGVFDFYLYLQDTTGGADGRLVIPDKTFPAVNEYFEAYYDSSAHITRIHTSNTNSRPIVIQEGSAAQFVGFHTATPTQSVDFGADTRHRSSEEARFGGTSTSDYRGVARWTGTLMDYGQGRHPTADTAGTDTQLQGGGATFGATNKNGGSACLVSGFATGNGQSDAVVKTVRPNQGSSTDSRSPVETARFTDGRLELTQAVIGSDIHREVHTATNDDPTLKRRGGRVATTNNTLTTLAAIATTTDKCLYIEATCVGHRTGGSGGATGDSCTYKIAGLFKNIAGTVTQVGSTGALFTAEDNSNCGAQFTISGTDVLVQVQGDTDNNYTWHTAKCETTEVGT